MSDIFELFKKIQKEKPQMTGPVEWIVAGLGNPGQQYGNTRHNIGFCALDALARDCGGVRVEQVKFKSAVGEAMIAGKRTLLMKPGTFMNLSGEAVAEAARFYKIPPEHILIFSDDVSLPVGKMRVRSKGSAGGHNGLKNIIYQLGSDNFPRVRIGVGEKPHPDYDLADWVLGKFPPEDAKTLLTLMDKIKPCTELIVSGKTDNAMNLYNGK